MRVFVALDIDDAIRTRIAQFMDGVRGFAPDARWVRAESLHVTLKFIGEKPPDAVEAIQHALAGVHARAVNIGVRGYGFFPTPKSARVFWVGVEAGAELAAVAGSVDEATARLGVEKEQRPYSAHLTLARGGGRSAAPHRQKGDSPNRDFQRLQEKLADFPAPEFGTMTAREFFLYESKFGPGGSSYSKIARFHLE